VKATGLVPTLLFCSLLSVDAYALWPDAEEEARCFIQKVALELRQNAAPEAAILAAEAERMLSKEILSLDDIKRFSENITRNISRQL
jgi:hypothetical protein